VPAWGRMTIIVVPETGKRTVSFRFSLYWIIPVMVLLVGLSSAVYLQYRQNQAMMKQVAELDGLRRTNRLQEAEIDGLHAKATQTDQKLSELKLLEEQLRTIVDPPLPARGAEGPTKPLHTSGRGGPSETSSAFTNIPSLGAMLPPDIRTYLFGKRDALPMHLQVPETAKIDHPGTDAAATEDLGLRFDGQLATMERLTAGLTETQQAVTEHLDYVAHEPSGIPVSGGSFTDRFGWRWSPFGWGRQWHDGLDIAQDYGVPIAATADGVVIHSGWKSGGYGYTVMIDHGYGLVTLYAHMSDTKPDLWQEVKRGDIIGWVGSSGSSTGPHVHYEVHLNGVPVDPVKYLQ
jgi:murein DD-endopeptidase MepM/ murein hydrolase activator NlpD